ncbi:MAG TPA: hypothetical protein VMQ73_24770 [Methylomirabilota bacterium]|nr:hypothetical protein [Methylomirabilota bacterium]
MERRTVLIGGGALAFSTLIGAAVGGAAYDRAGFFAAILRRLLTDAIVTDEEVEQFTEVYWPLMRSRYGSRAALMRVLHAADRMLIPGELKSSEQLERDVLTAFLIGSNFFQLKDPRNEPVDFVGISAACANPFRRD